MNTVVIVHGWGADSESDWIPWLKVELERRGARVIAPDMPNTNAPTIDSWVQFLGKIVKDAGEDFYFVGYSIGCQAVLRYLQTLPEGERVGGVVLVAGWTLLTGLSDEEEEVARPWEETPIEWTNVAAHSKAFVVIYSDNDPHVPERNARDFEEKLNAKLVLDSGRGHFTTDEDDVTQLPTVLDELRILMNMPD